MPKNWIAVEGIIGAGKTTLVNHLCEQVEAYKVLEEFEENPHLPEFYLGDSTYNLSNELYFLQQRAAQIDASPNDGLVISDYIFQKSKLFAKNNLTPTEYNIFSQRFQYYNATLPVPSYLIYIDISIARALKNIKSRNRQMEQQISEYYLTQLNTFYKEFLSSTSIPIIRITEDELYQTPLENLLKRIVQKIS